MHMYTYTCIYIYTHIRTHRYVYIYNSKISSLLNWRTTTTNENCEWLENCLFSQPKTVLSRGDRRQSSVVVHEKKWQSSFVTKKWKSSFVGGKKVIRSPQSWKSARYSLCYIKWPYSWMLKMIQTLGAEMGFLKSCLTSQNYSYLVW